MVIIYTASYLLSFPIFRCKLKAMSQGRDANRMWETSHGYQEGKFSGWVIYLLFGLLLVAFIVLWPLVERELNQPHPERPPASPNEWAEQ